MMTTLLNYVINRLDAIDISRQTIRYILLVFVLGLAGSLSIRAQSSNVVLNGVTLTTGFTLNWSETVLMLSESSTIALGTGNHSLTFAASNGVTWTGTTLTVTGWTGTAGFSGTGGKIFVGNNTSGLTSAQLAKISFDGYSGTATILSTGEVVPEGAGPTASVISNGTGNSTICAGGTANIKVTITGGVSPYSVTYFDGTGNTTVTNYTSGADITVSPLSTTTYTLVSVVDANNAPGTGNSGSATVTTTITVVPTSMGTYTATLNHTDGATLNYIDGSCRLLSRIEDASGGNVLGSTTVDAILSSTNIVGPNNGLNDQVYVRRNYEISASSDGVSVITFYASQSDFSTYNASNGSLLDMPTTGSNGDPNIANIRVAQVTGGTLYTGSFTYPTPTVNWNSSTSSWEITVTTAVNGVYYLFTDPSCNTSISNLAENSVTPYSVNLGWTAAAPPATSYDLRYRVVGATVWQPGGNTTSTSIVINGLSPNNEYEVQVKARCTPSTSGLYSETLTFTTESAPCGTPAVLNPITTTAQTASLSWASVPGASTYWIFYKLSSGSTWTSVSTSGTSMILTGLTSNTQYDVKIMNSCAIGGGLSPFSSTVQFMITSNLCLTTPVVINTPISVTSTSATITWGAVPGASTYFVFYKPTSSSTWSTPSTSSTSIVLGNLNPSTTYEVKVLNVCIGGGYSSFSSTEQFTTVGNPCISTPVVINTPISVTSTSATITWGAVSGVSTYFVFYKPTSSSTWSTPSTSSTSLVLGNLIPSTTYDVKVMNVCIGGGFSSFSTTQQFTTTANVCISTPVVINTPISVTSTSATITWDAVPGVSSYFVFYKPTSSSTWSTPSTPSTSLVLGNLIPSTTYDVKVLNVCSGGGYSSFSTTQQFTTTTPPPNIIMGDKGQIETSTEINDSNKKSDNRTNIIEISSIKIYPNPTAEVLYVSFEAAQAVETKIRVTDVTGRVVKEMYYTSTEGYNQTEINLGDLAQGVYMLQVLSGDGWLYTGRVVKTQ